MIECVHVTYKGFIEPIDHIKGLNKNLDLLTSPLNRKRKRSLRLKVLQNYLCLCLSLFLSENNVVHLSVKFPLLRIYLPGKIHRNRPKGGNGQFFL